MAPDTQQNLLYTVYFIILHNWEAIFYASGIILTTLWMFYRPTRAKILIMWGFIMLLFVFEYNKHILEPLREQTINSLITERQSWRIADTINRITMRIIPRGVPILGWLLIGVGTYLQILKKGFRIEKLDRIKNQET